MIKKTPKIERRKNWFFSKIKIIGFRKKKLRTNDEVFWKSNKKNIIEQKKSRIASFEVQFFEYWLMKSRNLAEIKKWKSLIFE